MLNQKPAKLILSNGKIFNGFALGKIGQSCGEVCFNTGMTGYQEVLTDPSYFGQLITFTYPELGNTGVNIDDQESFSPSVKGVISRQLTIKIRLGTVPFLKGAFALTFFPQVCICALNSVTRFL
mgnify:CR=1 FL=1